jgi:hypothetical protein
MQFIGHNYACSLLWFGAVPNSNMQLIRHTCQLPKPSIHPQLHLSIYLPIQLPFIHLFIYPSIHLFTHPSTHPSTHSPTCPSIIHLSIQPSIHPSIHPHTHPPIYPSIHPILLISHRYYLLSLSLSLQHPQILLHQVLHRPQWHRETRKTSVCVPLSYLQSNFTSIMSFVPTTFLRSLRIPFNGWGNGNTERTSNMVQ